MQTAHFILNKLMPLWLIVLGVLAYLVPAPFTVLTPYAAYMLGGVIMLMSLTLTMGSLGEVFVRPKAVIGGFVIKWITVPLAAVVAAHVFYSNQPALAAGTILDGSVPAGVSSNLFTFIAHGSVALAISLTFIHTLLSPLLTPAFTSAFASKYVPVNFFALLQQMLQLVIVPVVIGLAIRYGAGEKRIRRAEPVLPLLSAVLLYTIELGLISHSAPAIQKNLGWVPVVAGVTSLLTVINLVVAYALAKGLRLPERQARAIMFDVGIYNSGLGAVLAGLNFGPLSVLPPLLNAVLNMIIGALVASFLHNRVPAPDAETAFPALRPGIAAE
ncbi:MAG TPA: bile acid:sodium symporter family protein [Acetobacteraceae bacterium]|nr:bile acid:sodium symporter family protein [Acetobacteraceae bacterium]